MSTEPSFKAIGACKSFNEDVLNYIRTGPEHTIIIAARWQVTVHGGYLSPGEPPRNIPSISRAPGQALSQEEARTLLLQTLEHTIGILLKSGKRVFIVYPIPECSFNVPHVLALLSGRYGKASIQNLNISKSDYLARANDIQVAFDALPDAANFHRIKPADMLCNETRCLVFKDGKSLYFDDDHLSQAGAEYLSPLFAPVFNPSVD